MEDTINARKLREYYLSHPKRKGITNICRARVNWNGCDYCDTYSGSGCECWKQDAKHNCIYCEEVKK